MSGEWRVVIGSGGGYDLTGACESWFLGDGLLRDDRFDDYDTARAALEAIYVRWRSDSCEDCVARAAEDEVWLARVPRGGEFVGEVEGDDHLLIRSDRTQVQDLWDERERIEASL